MRKITKEELIRSPEFWEGNLKSYLFEMVRDYLKDNKITQNELAQKIGVSKGYISQLLNGDKDHRVSKIVELAIAIDKAPYLYFKDINEVVRDYQEGKSIFIDFDEMESNAQKVVVSKDYSPSRSIMESEDISFAAYDDEDGGKTDCKIVPFSDDLWLEEEDEDKHKMVGN